ncbi:MAG TPA: ComEC/Rec2 family competence protein, partial [Kofleriaceae bacterium]|nr:ComEC/Rec2 family competence protein [Kofleriaceae bacterium]
MVGPRPTMAALAVAGAAGVLAPGALGGPAAAWAGVALAAALLLRRRRWAVAVVLAMGAGAALAAREAAERRSAAAVVARHADDGRVDAVTGVVRGPVARTGRGERFALEAEGAPAVRVLVTVWRDEASEGADAGVMPGDRLRVRGLLRRGRGYRVPGAPDAEARAAAAGVHAYLSTDPSRIDVLEEGPRWDPWRLATRAQRRLADRIDRATRGMAAGGVLRALVTGDRGAMPEEQEAAYRDTGTSHVLAVSGMHLAAVALLLYALVRRAWAALPLVARRIEPARAAAAMGALAAVAYAMVTGASPSVVRALWVVLVFFAGVLLDRRARLVDALGLAAVLVLVERPSAIFDVSVQL